MSEPDKKIPKMTDWEHVKMKVTTVPREYADLIKDSRAMLDDIRSQKRLCPALGPLDSGLIAELIDRLEAATKKNDELTRVAERYEQWEGKLILDQEAWRGGCADLPTLTDDLWDELLEIQTIRNEALGRFQAK